MEVSCRLGIQPDVTVVDGSAILWILHWPNRGTVCDFVDNFTGYILAKNNTSDIYVVFDRYYDFSIKSGTRFARAGRHASRRHRLSMNAPLPPQNVVLTVTENKVQLIDLICHQLTDAGRGSKSKHRLVITGSDPTPVEIHHGIQLPRRDLLNTQEEADVIMIHKVAQVAEPGSQCINVISDDTDVFVLLMYHFFGNSTCRVD